MESDLSDVVSLLEHLKSYRKMLGADVYPYNLALGRERKKDHKFKASLYI